VKRGFVRGQCEAISVSFESEFYGAGASSSEENNQDKGTQAYIRTIRV
jgi:hypothetical protein